MIDINKMIIVNVAWMEAYKNKNEWKRPYDNLKSSFAYLNDHICAFPYECLNFKQRKNGYYWGYFPGLRGKNDSPKPINLSELKNNEKTKNDWTVIFVSKNPNEKIGLCIVGYYLNAIIYKELQNGPDELNNRGSIGTDKHPYRVMSKNAFCIPTNLRTFSINKDKKWMGRTNILYPVLNDIKRKDFFEKIKIYLENTYVKS